MDIEMLVTVVSIAAAFGGSAWVIAHSMGAINTNIVSSENRIIQKIASGNQELRQEIASGVEKLRSDNEKFRVEFKQDIKDSEARTNEKIGLSDKMDKLHSVV